MIYKLLLILIFSIPSFGINLNQKDLLETTIYLKGKNKGNVIQGITFFQNQWIVSQTIHNKKLIISFLNLKGEELKKNIISYPSHGQDLSILHYHGKYYLITSSKKNQGIAIFILKNHQFILYKEVFLSLGFNTPTVSENGQYIAVKNHNTIRIYRCLDILQSINPHPIYSFLLSKLQQKKSQWFQGITIKDNFIYTLSGNNKLTTNKYLTIYDAYGKIQQVFTLSTGKRFAQIEGKKWELEGLSFKKNKLYTTVMSGKDGHNIKRLYQILEIGNK
jgi:hypothetical protein